MYITTLLPIPTIKIHMVICLMLECFPGLFGFTVVMHPRVCSFWCGGEGGGGALQLLQISNLFSVLLDSFLMADLFQFF